MSTVAQVIALANVVTHWIMMVTYYRQGNWGSGTGMLLVWVLSTLTQWEFDYFNNGRTRFIFPGEDAMRRLADVLQLRVLVDFRAYYIDWLRHRTRAWAGKDFRSAIRFETFLASMPSLIIQTHVIVEYPYQITDIQLGSLVITCLQCLIDLLHFFKYVSLNWQIYAQMLVKAIINTAYRTALSSYCLVVLSLKLCCVRSCGAGD